MITVADVFEWLREEPDEAAEASMQRCLDAVVNSVEQRCTLGSEYPPDVVLAVIMSAARLRKRQETSEGVINFGDDNVIRVGSFDADVERLLAPHLAWNFA